MGGSGTATVLAMPDPSPTRQRLLDAAARLYAERGIENVSIAEIVRAADQRNASAVHYHFGGRDDLLQALLARTVPLIAERRRHLLDAARADPSADPHSAAEAIIRPVTELATLGWRERAYLRIGSEVAGARRPVGRPIRAVLAATAGPEAWALLRQRLAPLDDELWRARQELGIVMVAGAAAERARRLDRGERNVALDDGRFVGNLVEMVVGAMGAPAPDAPGGPGRADRLGAHGP